MRTRFSIRPGWRSTKIVSSIRLNDDKTDSARRLRRGARKRGRMAGRAAAFDHPQAERMQDLPGRIMLEKAVGKRKKFASAWTGWRRQALKARLDELRDLIEQAGDDARSAKEQLARAERDLTEASSVHSPNLPTYLLVLGLLAAAEYPTLSSALRVFPFSAATRQFLACVLSVVLAVAAHYLAKRICVLRASRDAGRALPRFDTAFVGVFMVVIVGLMVVMSITRGDAFDQLASLTGNAFGDPAVLTALMLALQVTLFVIALAVGLQHTEGDPRRRAAKRHRRARRAARSTDARRGARVAEKSATQQELKNLAETERLWIAREDELLGELLARHDHAYEATEHSIWTRMCARVIAPRLGSARA